MPSLSVYVYSWEFSRDVVEICHEYFVHDLWVRYVIKCIFSQPSVLSLLYIHKRFYACAYVAFLIYLLNEFGKSGKMRTLPSLILVSSADKLCKQFGLRFGPTKHRA